MRASCSTPPQELLSYWLGELENARERELDEHLLACDACCDRLRAIVELGAAIRRETLGGDCAFVVPAPFIGRLKEAGLRVREYTLGPGDRVSCTVTSDDDLVVSHLHAPLRGVRRLDVVVDDPTVGTHRVSDVAFDPEAGGVSMVPNVSHLRKLGRVRQRVRFLAVDDEGERVIADYTFDHSPS